MSTGQQKRLAGLILVLAASALVGWGCNGCNREANQPDPAERPTLRLYVVGGAAGAIEPCGCVKDMLGGVDHAAALLRAEAKHVPAQLVVGAGPMLFSDPKLEPERQSQAKFKARALADSFKDMGLVAWAPGINDWALGPSELAELQQASGAKLLAGNLAIEDSLFDATLVKTVNDFKVGMAGVLISSPQPGLPEGVSFERALATLQASQQKLIAAGADLRVAVVAAPRGDALRLIERVSGFQLLVLGKPFDQGEHNDEPIVPTIVGDTLVVQAPNHLQAIATVDLFVRGEDYSFQDSTGVERMARSESLRQRINELHTRLAEWEKNGASQVDLKARRKELDELKLERQRLEKAVQPAQGSFYTYRLVEVRESLGVDPNVKNRLVAYYKRVNQHNKELFKDKLPTPATDGVASYLGVEKCGSCHLQELEFWKGTSHAKAYGTLVKDHKQFNLDCVSCHVSGYEKPGGTTVTHVEGLVDVQCEVCHGPGSLHVGNPADLKLIAKAPERDFCAGACHHPPHVKPDWSVDEAWQKILGPGHGR